jgi:hypothetical protein
MKIRVYTQRFNLFNINDRNLVIAFPNLNENYLSFNSSYLAQLQLYPLNRREFTQFIGWVCKANQCCSFKALSSSLVLSVGLSQRLQAWCVSCKNLI